jgi:hypothetical protein
MPYDDATPHLGIRLLYAHQSRKEVAANDAFLALDALLNSGAASRTANDPPSSPGDGAAYIVGPVPTGAWSGQAEKTAHYRADVGWTFLAPNEGLTLWVNDEDVPYTWNGAAWVKTVDKERADKVGVNTDADATNRLSVRSASSLFSHDGSDARIKINKNAAGDTASLLFQTGFSGRAEIGLAGVDDLCVKVSPDGSVWYDAATADRSSGAISLPSPLRLADGSASAPALAFAADTNNGFFRPSADVLAYAANGAEAVRFGATGVSFNGGANYLEKYEEGTWTPTLYGATTAGTTTYTAQDGSYTRVGNRIVCGGRVIWTNATGTGAARIGGLPFTAVSGSQNRGMISWQYYHSLNMGLIPTKVPNAT